MNKPTHISLCPQDDNRYMSRDTEVVGEMQKSPGRQARHVHFGEVEDILSTSFYNEALDEDEGEESEEQKKKKDINAR